LLISRLCIDQNPLGQNIKPFCNFLQLLTNLQFLNLSSCEIKAEDSAFFGKSLSYLSKLTHLYLDENPLCDCSEIWNACKDLKDLKTLSLKKVEMDSKAASPLKNFLKKSTLEKLFLSKNFFDVSFIKEIIDSMVSSRTLIHIYMDSCTLKKECAEIIFTRLVSNKSISYFNINDNLFTVDKDLENIFQNLYSKNSIIKNVSCVQKENAELIEFKANIRKSFAGRSVIC
jgi:Ran GTPase-activating protein (RanGAP) involved in mRNA processing and transport